MVNKFGNGAGLWVIDAIGGTIVALAALSAVWMTFLRDDGARATLRELNRVVSTANTDLTRVRLLRDQQRLALTEEKSRFDSQGHPPDHPPLEEYFQTLAALTKQLDLQLRSQAPLPPRFYPSLAEHRFVCEISGTMPALAALFHAIETTEFWADVSYFKIDSGRIATSAASEERSAQLSFSLFAAPPVQSAAPAGKG